MESLWWRKRYRLLKYRYERLYFMDKAKLDPKG